MHVNTFGASMDFRVWDKITYPVAPLKSGNLFPFLYQGAVRVPFYEVGRIRVEWISNCIPHYMMDVITYSCWDWSYSLLIKRVSVVSCKCNIYIYICILDCVIIELHCICRQGVSADMYIQTHRHIRNIDRLYSAVCVLEHFSINQHYMIMYEVLNVTNDFYRWLC